MDIDATYTAIRDPDEPDNPDGPAPTWLVVDDRNAAILGALNPEEAQRIAACLNLARGIPTEVLATSIWQVRKKQRNQTNQVNTGKEAPDLP